MKWKLIGWIALFVLTNVASFFLWMARGAILNMIWIAA